MNNHIWTDLWLFLDMNGQFFVALSSSSLSVKNSHFLLVQNIFSFCWVSMMGEFIKIAKMSQCLNFKCYLNDMETCVLSFSCRRAHARSEPSYSSVQWIVTTFNVLYSNFFHVMHQKYQQFTEPNCIKCKFFEREEMSFGKSCISKKGMYKKNEWRKTKSNVEIPKSDVIQVIMYSRKTLKACLIEWNLGSTELIESKTATIIWI